MNEKLIEKKFRERIKRLGGLALKFWCVSFTGMPDRLILMPFGRVYFAEIKTTGKKPSPIQKVIISKLRLLGFTVFVIDDEMTLYSSLSTIENRLTNDKIEKEKLIKELKSLLD